ncbi:MAG: hypothetical protein KJ583_06960 [Nanoarchaeota archaeon]|nr:hypothetical protein [Nanoarchaeota archaeon]MBU1269214.1 hypothetical protein [Nanoarchaeota archaeon]MBU1605025.1 hypothetical protein [Nanoarchaeota archaeon]MBU2443577.1 hypothetical protein [Nanoarchaeota archaeon]
MSKRGQGASAGGAAIFVILIAVLIVIYILFLPPQNRAELLGENDTNNGDNGVNGLSKVLLQEHVGRLDYLKFDYREHNIPSFRIYASREGKTLKNVNSIFVKNGVGDKKFFNFTFDIDKKLTSNLQLTFNVEDSAGNLELYLNGQEIFSGFIDKGTPQPISLPSEFLSQRNVLSFQVSSPRFAIWRTNRYQLKNVVITGDVLDVSNSKNKQFFYLSDVEYNNLETIKLKFYPNCQVTTVGPMMIYLNGEILFSGVADCGVYKILPLDKNFVTNDRNELEFIVTEGSYLIDRVSVVVQLESLTYPVFYFELDEDKDYVLNDEFDKDNYNITMTLRFVNKDSKNLEYLINGRRKYIRTTDLKYTINLDDYVEVGTNSLELIPKSLVDIAELKVVVVEDD